MVHSGNSAILESYISQTEYKYCPGYFRSYRQVTVRNDEVNQHVLKAIKQKVLKSFNTSEGLKSEWVLDSI